MLDAWRPAFAGNIFEQAYCYWLSKCNAQRIPARRDIDPAEMVRFLPHVTLVDVLEPLDFRFRLIGTAISDRQQGQQTGACFSRLEGKGPGNPIWSDYDTVRDSASPVFRTVSYIGPTEDVRAAVHLLLPLSVQSDRVEMIFGCVGFDIVRRRSVLPRLDATGFEKPVDLQSQDSAVPRDLPLPKVA